MKRCSKCRKELSMDMFYSSGKYIQSWCKDCMKSYKKKYYLKNNEKIKQSVRQFYKNNKGKFSKAKKVYQTTNSHRLRHKCSEAVRRAVAIGKIIKGQCSYPNGECDGNIEAHHWCYDKPTDVVFFCRKHHRLADRVRKFIT